MAALTNLQQTGHVGGARPGRRDARVAGAGGRARARRRGARLSLFGLAGDGGAATRDALDLATGRARAGAAAGPRGRVDAPAQALLALGRRHAARRPVDRTRAHRLARGRGARAPRRVPARRRSTRRDDATDVVASRRPAAAAARHVAGVRRGGALAAGAHRDHLEVAGAGRGRVGGARRPLAAEGPGRHRRRAVRLLPDVRPPRRGAPVRRGPARRDGLCASSTSTWRPASRIPSRSPARTARGASRATRPSTGASPPRSTARSRPSTATTG